jgi:hypothetical protein
MDSTKQMTINGTEVAIDWRNHKLGNLIDWFCIDLNAEAVSKK